MGSTRKYNDQINRQANESTSLTRKLFICTPEGVTPHPAVREELDSNRIQTGIKQIGKVRAQQVETTEGYHPSKVNVAEKSDEDNIQLVTD